MDCWRLRFLRERLLSSRHAGRPLVQALQLHHACVAETVSGQNQLPCASFCSTASKAPPAVSTMRRQATLAAFNRRCSCARRAAQACQAWNFRARERCCRPTLKRRAWRVPRMLREALSQNAASATDRRALDPLQGDWSCCGCITSLQRNFWEIGAKQASDLISICCLLW